MAAATTANILPKLAQSQFLAPPIKVTTASSTKEEAVNSLPHRFIDSVCPVSTLVLTAVLLLAAWSIIFWTFPLSEVVLSFQSSSSSPLITTATQPVGEQQPSTLTKLLTVVDSGFTTKSTSQQTIVITAALPNGNFVLVYNNGITPTGWDLLQISASTNPGMLVGIITPSDKVLPSCELVANFSNSNNAIPVIVLKHWEIVFPCLCSLGEWYQHSSSKPTVNILATKFLNWRYSLFQTTPIDIACAVNITNWPMLEFTNFYTNLENYTHFISQLSPELTVDETVIASLNSTLGWTLTLLPPSSIDQYSSTSSSFLFGGNKNIIDLDINKIHQQLSIETRLTLLCPKT
jgi:hypothetical protein